MRGIILLQSSNNENIDFRQIYDIAPQYVKQAMDMARVFQDAVVPVKIDGKDSLKFDFDKALAQVKAHSEMAMVGIVNQTISQSSSQASSMVNKIIELVKNVLSVTLTEKQKETYEACITNAFTNLSTQSQDAWIFWQHEESHKTTYQYNMFFAIQNEDTGSVMLALPMSLTVTVNVEKEKVLWITIKDKHDFSVNVQAIQVVEALKQ